MSVDINWDTFTSGPDGEVLAENIRSFIHDKFQQVELPRFIRSVQVHSFDFGTICPELEIKDICDPLPDFYEEDEDDEEANPEGASNQGLAPDITNEQNINRLQEQLRSNGGAMQNGKKRRESNFPPQIDTRLQGIASPLGLAGYHGSPFRSGTPGIPGGTSNLSYFHLPLGGGISGTQTPLAAVAGGTPFSHGWHDHGDGHGTNTNSFFPRGDYPPLPQATQNQRVGSPSRPSTAATVPPMSPESLAPVESRDLAIGLDDDGNDLDALNEAASPRMTEKGTDDIQVVSHVKYAGDIRMTLTAEILLDYPMPSFVGIPLKLSITGLKFDGFAIVAYIRNRAHFCFLSPEDALALVGNDEDGLHRESREDILDHVADKTQSTSKSEDRLGGLLQEIEVESEIGKKENGKQVLKNVSKVERFVLEQVRRIFEEEFVFPSFWTFLV